VVIAVKVRSGLLALLRLAGGSTAFNRLPVPRVWDPAKRPHVARLEAIGDGVLSFYLTHPADEDTNLGLSDVENVPDGTIMEVRHSELDTRYYRREAEMWRMVAELKNEFYIEVYDGGTVPVVVPLSREGSHSSD
jgi:hypothetical protein